MSRFYYDKQILTVFAQMWSVQAANRPNQETITIVIQFSSFSEAQEKFCALPNHNDCYVIRPLRSFVQPLSDLIQF